MVRGFLVLISALWAAQAFAGVTAETFTWERSGRFFLNVTVDGNRVELKGNVRLGESTDARQGAVAAQVKSYGVSGSTVSPVISAIISIDGNDDAFVVLIQADGDRDTKKIITPVAIRDRKATAARDLEFILNGLKSRKNWDALASFNWLQTVSAGKQLFQIADKVETASDADIAVPKPQPRVAEGQGQTVRTPQLPRDARGMDPNSLNNGYPPPPPRYAGRGQLPPIQDDDSQFSDGPRPPQDIQPPAQQQQQPQQPRRYRPPQQIQTDQYGYPLPPEMQGQGYPQQRYPQPQQRYPRGYGGYGGYGGYAGNNGYPPPPPFGGGGFLQ